MQSSVIVALPLFKIALGVTHNVRDDYYIAYLDGVLAELVTRGVEIDTTNTSDVMLLVDYAEFCYRSRDSAKALPLNLDIRIRNKKAKGRIDNA